MRKACFAALLVFVFLPGFLAGLFAQYPVVGRITDPHNDISTRAVAEKDGFVYLVTRDGYFCVSDISSLKTTDEYQVFSKPLYEERLFSSHGGEGVLRYQDQLVAYGWDGVLIKDISNPAKPVATNFYNSGIVFNAIIHGQYLICCQDKKVEILALQPNAGKPTFVSKLDAVSVRAAAVHSNRLYVAVTDAAYVLKEVNVIDFSDPSHPVPLSSFTVPDWPYHLRTIGDRLLFSATDSVSVWSLTNPDSPALLDTYSLLANGMSILQRGNGRSCVVDGPRVIIGGEVVRLEGDDLKVVTSYDPGPGYAQIDGASYGGTMSEDYIFIASSRGITILDRKRFAPVAFPQFALGGGYEVELVVSNPSDAEWGGKLEPRQAKDQPWQSAWSANGQTMTGSKEILLDLKPKTTASFLFQGDQTARAGYFRIAGNRGMSAADLSTSFSYKLKSTSGDVIDTIGVAPGRLDNHFSFVVQAGPTTNTGLALGPGQVAEGFHVYLTLFDAAGKMVQQKDVLFSGHRALFFNELFDVTDPTFTGHVEVVSAKTIYLAVLRLELTPSGIQLTTVPIGP